MASERVLLIEDDPAIVAGLELNLALEGYEVLTAADGEAGLAGWEAPLAAAGVEAPPPPELPPDPPVAAEASFLAASL